MEEVELSAGTIEHETGGADASPNRLRAPSGWQTLRFGIDPDGFLSAAQRRHGDAFTMRVLGDTITVLADPASVKEVFGHGPDELNSGEANLQFRPLIGARNVFLLDGEDHLRRRRLVLPHFHGARMRAYDELIRSATRKEISTWPTGKPEAALPHAQALTFAVIMQSVFGLREGERMDRVSSALLAMVAWITDIRRILIAGAMGPAHLMSLRRFDEHVEAVDREIKREIELRRGADDLDQREDILSLLLQARDEEGRGLTDQELRDELVTLLMAGHETTATLIAWALHELARKPESQERLAREPDGYCDAVITETLRLRPPAPLVPRRLRVPLTIAGHELPAGSTVAPCTLLVHRRPDVYPDPLEFRPERFLDRRPVASEWFPFGGAVRRCIGAAFTQFEARIVLEELLDAFRFAPDRPRPERFGRRGPVLVPSRGARLIATRR